MIFQIVFIIGSAVIKNVQACDGVPDHCPTDRINFRLYTISTESYHKLDLHNHNTIAKANFHKNAPVKVILHGYTGSADNDLMQRLIKEYLRSTTPVNVIMVNYEKIARSGCYPRLFWNAGALGKCIAKMIQQIVKRCEGVTIKQFHLIGFSIGAHIAAETSNHLDKSVELERITGLDPAFMFFFPVVLSGKHKLNKQHAKFVDVIHTNVFWYGIPYCGAHYDIYANGGRTQPNCEDSKEKPRCYHKMAVEYFINTINTTGMYKASKIPCSVWWWFTGYCSIDNLPTMEIGEHAVAPNKLQEGIYNFETSQ